METTRDSFLGGALTLQQPKTGYRAGQDPVLLAAACAIEPGQSFMDLGCGVGTLGLCLSTRVADVRGRGIELDPSLVRLAQANGLEARQGDLIQLKPAPDQRADWVLSNPPFFDADAGRASPNNQRQQGRQGRDVRGWIRAVMAWVAPRGRLGLILNSVQAPAAMAALQPSFGGLVLMPILGKASAATADRCLLFARQGSRSSFILASTLVIRDGEGALTSQAKGVLGRPEHLPFPLVK